MASRSLDQERAAFAWKKVQDPSKDFINLASGAPALIMSNGLMQTLAFYKDKGKEHHIKLLDAIIEWVGKREFEGIKTFSELLERLHSEKTTSDSYMRATEEALGILRWIRQFAKARGKEA